MSFWSEESKIDGSEQSSTSLCGRYKLTTWKHKTGPKTWDYSSGLVEENREINPGESVEAYKSRIHITKIERNYGHFPYCWLHRGNETFLFYGEDYQGYGCLNCSTGERVDYLPVGYRSGGAFCWGSIKPDQESDNHLLVEGCVWGGPWDRMRYDVTNLFSFLYPKEYLGSADNDDDDNEAEADS